MASSPDPPPRVRLAHPLSHQPASTPAHGGSVGLAGTAPPLPHPPFTVGDRLRVGAGTPTHPAPAATVRYVGPVAGTAPSTTWVGLEYDEDGRGKHDGCVKKKSATIDSLPDPGIRYFSTRPGASAAGSLVREAALAGVAVRGITLLDGLRARYQAGVVVGGADHPSSSSSHHLAGAAAVAARQADLMALASACLAGSPVCGAGAGDMRSILPALTDLDLSGSLVPDWAAGAAALGRALPGLASLSLAACGLGAGGAASVGGPGPPVPWAPAFPALRTLVLARTGLGWGDVLATVAPDTPALESLSLAHCGLVAVAPPPPPTVLTRLTALDLGGNALAGVDALAGVWGTAAALPALACLDLTTNPCLFSGGGGGLPAAPAVSLPGLVTLRLGGCGLTAWSDVVALVGEAAAGGGDSTEAGSIAAPPPPHHASILAPALTSVRLSDNHFPAWAPSAGSHRADLVARLPPRIARLNGADVSGRERADAVRALGRARAAAEGGAAAPPPRPPLAASLASLTLRFSDSSTHTVRLPASTTVGRLRMVVERLGRGVGGDAAVLRAAPAGEGRDSPATTVLGQEEDGRDLEFLGLGGGGEVWVENAC
jgi:hypothetical protein